jgi:hypothetical protein
MEKREKSRGKPPMKTISEVVENSFRLWKEKKET